MKLADGERLGRYKIFKQLGAGGMGIVYRAYDTELERDVAIKVSADQYSDRFRREALLAASFNHPNLCTIHDVGPNYLVMEYIEGEPLSAVIKRGSIELDTALEIAFQIADGLSAAHKKKIAHRDLKPQNIMVLPSGGAKILDFGLAKLISGDSADEDITRTVSLTQPGMIVGTVPYMSPEQLKGEVDHRADIWAFGVLLFEMVTGRRPFLGRTSQDVIAAIQHSEVDYSRVPPRLHNLLKRCLQKDPSKRLDSLESARALAFDPSAGPRSANRISFATALIALVILMGLGIWMFRSKLPFGSEPPAPQRTFNTQPPRSLRVSDTAPFELAPNGEQVAYTTDQGIAVWNMQNETARLISGTEGGVRPFWSPDGSRIVFSTSGGTFKVGLDGQPPQPLIVGPRDNKTGAWSPKGYILYVNQDQGISRISENGGPSTVVTVLPQDGNSRHDELPHFLPDGRHFLYFRHRNSGSAIMLGDAEKGPTQQHQSPIVPATDAPLFVQPPGSEGFLLFLDKEKLFAQKFDPTSMTLSGERIMVVDNVLSDGGNRLFSATRTGTILVRNATGEQSQLTWMNREGFAGNIVGEPGKYREIRLSPSGEQVVYRDSNQIFLLNLLQGAPLALVADGRSFVWSPDGTQIAYSVNGEIFRQNLTGTRVKESLVKGPGLNSPSHWSRDGRFLLFTRATKEPGDVMLLSFANGRPGKVVPVMDTANDEREAVLAPNGRWLAYLYADQKERHLHIRAFDPLEMQAVGEPVVASREEVALSAPVWRDDSSEIYFKTAKEGSLVAVDVQAGGRGVPLVGPPKKLFRMKGYAWDARPDGEAFLVSEERGAAFLRVILNWRPADSR